MSEEENDNFLPTECPSCECPSCECPSCECPTMESCESCCDTTNCCPSCWTEGCGPCDCIFSTIASILETVNPCLSAFSHAIFCLGSPLSFPIIFCFSPEPHSLDTMGWTVSMLRAPLVRPLTCCCAMLIPPVGQWYVRRKALHGDMTRYKLWQGYHDGPHCMARVCPSAPITIRSGTYGEDQCPDAFLCLEVWILGGPFSACCAFDVSRRLMRDEREGLSIDPTEARYDKCMECCGMVAQNCWLMACCLKCCACLVGCCAPESEGAEEFEGAAGTASAACFRIARTIYDGMWSVRVVAMGCMSAQMVHEDAVGKEPDYSVIEAPKSIEMDRAVVH